MVVVVVVVMMMMISKAAFLYLKGMVLTAHVRYQ
jgi:hypothetical protein